MIIPQTCYNLSTPVAHTLTGEKSFVGIQNLFRCPACENVSKTFVKYVRLQNLKELCADCVGHVTLRWHHNERDGGTIVCSNIYSGADQRKHQSSTSLAFVRGIQQWPVNSPHKGPVTQKMFPFDDVIMRTCDNILPHAGHTLTPHI